MTRDGGSGWVGAAPGGRCVVFPYVDVSRLFSTKFLHHFNSCSEPVLGAIKLTLGSLGSLTLCRMNVNFFVF